MILRDKKIFKGLLPEHPVILDIGCFDGKDGLELQELFHGELHAFDPIDHFIGHKMKDVFFYNTALGNVEDGVAYFHQSPSHPQSGSLSVPTGHKEIWPDIDYTPPIKIPITKLDSIWPAGVPIDLIWADLNGSEAEFIKGAKQTLKDTRYLYIEVAYKELFQGQLLQDDILKLLPTWSVKGTYNKGENFGNLLLRNRRH